MLERGDVSAVELHRAYLDAIAARDDELHCFLRTVDDPAGDGVPIALKDVIGIGPPSSQNDQNERAPSRGPVTLGSERKA